MENSRSHLAPFKIVGGRGTSPALDLRGHGGLRAAAAPRFVRSLPMRGQTARSSFNHAVPADSPGTRRAQATEVQPCT